MIIKQSRVEMEYSAFISSLLSVSANVFYLLLDSPGLARWFVAVPGGGRPMPPGGCVCWGMTQSSAAFLCRRGGAIGCQAAMSAASTRAATAKSFTKTPEGRERGEANT